LSADSQHLELLRRGPRPWNEWRAENPSIIPNLVGVTLSIGDRQLGPINGGPINLAYARLRHAFLRFATLTEAGLEGADLSDTDLRDARLESADLSGADLSDALLDRADFAGAKLTGTNLCGASLLDVRNLTQEQLYEAEGDAFTVLPGHLSRPTLWAVAQVVEAPARIPRPALRRVEEQREEEQPQRGERISWLIGGPRSAGRDAPADTSRGDRQGS
jgi:Pentapeptide repeats (8 copies)